MIVATFNNINIEPAVGYRIAAAWKPGLGFGDNFFVYLWDMNNAPVPLKAVSVGAPGKPATGDLSIKDEVRQYDFKGIQLVSAQVGATRGFRYRQLEFQYTSTALTTGSTPITLSNSDQYEPGQAGLGTDYTVDLDDGAKELLGFRYRPTAQGGIAIRFSVFRNKKNCFLQKMIKANDDKNQSNPMTPFSVAFSQHTFDVNSKTLEEMFVDETNGFMLGEAPPNLSALVDINNPMPARDAVLWRQNDFTPADLIRFDKNQGPPPRESSGRTIETATFVFKSASDVQNIPIK